MEIEDNQSFKGHRWINSGAKVFELNTQIICLSGMRDCSCGIELRQWCGSLCRRTFPLALTGVLCTPICTHLYWIILSYFKTCKKTHKSNVTYWNLLRFMKRNKENVSSKVLVCYEWIMLYMCWCIETALIPREVMVNNFISQKEK